MVVVGWGGMSTMVVVVVGWHEYDSGSRGGVEWHDYESAVLRRVHLVSRDDSVHK